MKRRHLLCVVALALLLMGCQATTPVTSPTPPVQPATIPIPPSPGPAATSIKPPPALLATSTATQTSGIGTYCWQAGTMGTCADYGGVVTPREPLRLTSTTTVTLHLPVDAPPASISWAVQAVTETDKLEGSAPGEHSWRIDPSETAHNLPLQKVQAVELRVEPGWHVIRVDVVWPGLGDVTYGFFVDAR